MIEIKDICIPDEDRKFISYMLELDSTNVNKLICEITIRFGGMRPYHYYYIGHYIGSLISTRNEINNININLKWQRLN